LPENFLFNFEIMTHNLKCFLLTIITESQTQRDMATQLAETIRIELDSGWEIENVSLYTKFEDSYKIELKGIYRGFEQGELNTLAIRLTDKMVSPWVVYYDEDTNSLELIYNKSPHSRDRRQVFKVIKWGHLQMSDG
jgi:IS30 family transposase